VTPTTLGPAELRWIATACAALALSDRLHQQRALAQATEDYQRAVRLCRALSRQAVRS
jgi:hypothetical protein